MSSLLSRLDARLPLNKSERIILGIVIALHVLFLIGFQSSMHRTRDNSADDARVMANLVSPASAPQPAVAPAAAPIPPPPQPKQEKKKVLDEKSTEVQKPEPKAPTPKFSKPNITTQNEANSNETQVPRTVVAPAASDRASGTPIQTDIGKLTVIYQPDADAYYPSFSKRSGEQGTVVVRLIISESGEVNGIALLRSSSFPRLDRAAEEIGRRYRFAPYLVNGVPSKITTNLLITFNLKN